MVLHNDKWKYKAKRNYERKHAIKPAGKNSSKEGTERSRADQDDSSSGHDSDGESSDSSTNSGNESGDGEGESFRRKSKRNPKSSNSWRFEDPVVDESILKDPEYIARLNAIKTEEENRAVYMRNVVNEKLKTAGVDENDTQINADFSRPKEIKNMKKFKQNDLQNWKFDDDDDNEDSLSGAEVRDFTPEEREKFLNLQKNINHQKEMDKIRTRMDHLNNKNHSSKAKVLELKSNRGTDQYRAVVDKNLRHAHDKVDTAELDDLVGKMIGVDLTSPAEHARANNDQFDLDTLLKRPTGAATTKTNPSVGTAPNQAPLVQLETSKLDDFLDSVL